MKTRGKARELENEGGEQRGNGRRRGKEKGCSEDSTYVRVIARQFI